MNLFNKLKYFELLYRSRKLKNKVIVIESDDWGSERIPNLKIRNELKKIDIDVETNPHLKYDTLERLEDIEILQNILENLERKFDKKIKLTFNFIVSNPDFENIKKHHFEKFIYEKFTTTYFNRDGNNYLWLKICELIKKGYLIPQFHGREHINVSLWLSELKRGNKKLLRAFEIGCYGIDKYDSLTGRNNLMAAFEYSNNNEKKFVIESINDGLSLFEAIFNRKSTTLVAPRHTWNADLEPFINQLGVSAIQTSMYQISHERDQYKRIFRYTGMVNSNSGIVYLVRNAFFEPSYSSKIDWVNKTFKKIHLAFAFNVPVIIGMHRINFVGGLSPYQRDLNYELFIKLIEKIIKHFPDVEFLSSNELLNHIKS
ncbi:MAG: hypothetical protein ACK4EX_08845 [Thermaurantimonas sp.]|uniref:hypothetical protein n=1 Tax=Thermaurantimonas sp. TaxID=2681568 RepID=UPI00391C8788